MSKIFKVQPSEFTDHLSEDGTERTKLPYPYFVDEAGLVGRQDFWNGDPYQVIGFAKDLAVANVDLLWKEATENPSRAVGMYLVTLDEDGDFGTHLAAVSSMVLLSGEAS